MPRLETGIGEFDRAIGGGLAAGSAILLAGDPGIGKSTLLLQLAAKLASAGKRAVYFSGEEAAQQIRMRAKRLGVSNAPVELAAETNTAAILSTLEDGAPPDLVVINSIQTLWTDMLDAAPGTVSQVRASVQALISYAKRRTSSIILVGHVTKDGQIAGPKGRRAHGRYRALFRGRQQPSVPPAALGEEPFRPGERGRRVRDGRRAD